MVLGITLYVGFWVELSERVPGGTFVSEFSYGHKPSVVFIIYIHSFLIPKTNVTMNQQTSTQTASSRSSVSVSKYVCLYFCVHSI